MVLAMVLACAAGGVAVALMWWRTPDEAVGAASWSTAPTAVAPTAGPAWILAEGRFEVLGRVRRAGEPAFGEVALRRPLRRPPLASKVGETSPPPGTVGLIVERARNCDPESLQALTSGQPRCTDDVLVFAVDAVEPGPVSLSGRFTVRA
jgi:hypothetical protein